MLIMRILLVLTCCFGLASFAGAAQQDDQNQNQGKKKGGGNAQSQQQQVVAPQTGKKFKAGPGGGPHTQNFQQPSTVTHYNATGKKGKWQGPVTGGNPNLSGQTNVSAKNTTFNKSVNKNITVNKNFKVQKFNLPKNPNPSSMEITTSTGPRIGKAPSMSFSRITIRSGMTSGGGARTTTTSCLCLEHRISGTPAIGTRPGVTIPGPPIIMMDRSTPRIRKWIRARR